MTDEVELVLQKFRELAAKFAAGWDTEPEPSRDYLLYEQAFKEAARRINNLADDIARGRVE